MAGPARGGQALVARPLYHRKLALHHLIAMGMRCMNAEPARRKVASQPFNHQALHPWHQEQKAQCTGQKPGQDQQDRRQHGKAALSQMHDRHVPPDLLRPNPAPAQNGYAQKERPHNQRQRGPKTKRPAQRDKKADLDQRNSENKRKDPHVFVLRRCKLDLRRHSPYISSQGPNLQPFGQNCAEVEMNSSLLQLLVLAGIAVFLILKLRAVLGTREGFEKPPLPADGAKPRAVQKFEVIEGGLDRDITDHVAEGTDAARALAAMKQAEPGFSVSDFLTGARGAYEMILMAFERGDIESIRPFLNDEVEASFAQAINARERQGLTVEANFIGLRELAIAEAEFDATSRTAEITVRFTGELTTVVRNAAGEVVDGHPTSPKRQRDAWTFARRMGVQDPNWQLVATGE